MLSFSCVKVAGYVTKMLTLKGKVVRLMMGEEMPLYEYVCSRCGFRFELLRPISRSSEGASCPCCQNGAERVLSPFTSFSKSDSGVTTALGGSSCSSCSAASCDSCHL